MKTSTLFFVLALAWCDAGAQWLESESMPGKNGAINDGSPEPSAVWPYANQAAYSAGRFIIKPDNSGRLNFDTTLARNLQRAIDSITSLYVSPRGISAAVFIPGQGMWVGTTGLSTLDPPDSIKHDMLFHIGSNTKGFISTIILKLAEEGRLSLEDSIGRHLPSFPNISGSITIRQLLNMTAGLFDFFNDSPAAWNATLADPGRYWSPEEVLTTFVGPPRQQPGGPWRYCNTNLILAGMIVRNIAQTNISAHLHQRILNPLSMTRTFFAGEDSLVGPIAHPWYNGADFSPYYGRAMFSLPWTAGALFSTAENSARWSSALYGGEMLTPASQTQLFNVVSASRSDFSGSGITFDGYGLCVMHFSLLGKPLWGHYGRIPGYESIVTHLPANGVSVAVLFNRSFTNNTVANAATSALYHEYLRTVPTASATRGIAYALSGGTGSRTTYAFNISSDTLKEVGQYRYGDIVSSRIHPKTNVLWGLASAFGWELVNIDGITGEAYPKVKVTLPAGSRTDLKGMDFFSDDSVYIGSFDGRIYAVDIKSGGARLVFSPGIPISGLAFTRKTAQLWAAIRSSSALRDRIYSIDLKTGDTLGVGNTQLSAPLADIDFNPAEDLFGVYTEGNTSPDCRLVRIDMATGKATQVGSFGGTSIQTIAFSPTVTDVEETVVAERAAAFSLGQNYPNPFNPKTVVSYQLPVASHMTLVVYDLLGREVATLVNENKPAGVHSVQFDASGLASGVYLYRMTAGSYTSTRKMVVMK